MRVGLFSGCFIDFVDPEMGLRLLRVLGRHGVEVVFPKKQTCCGIPVFMSGDVENGLDLLKMNIEAFDPHKVDAVITACATCGSALKESYKNLVEGESQDLQERVKTFGARVMDVAEFLTQKIQLTTGEKKAGPEGHLPRPLPPQPEPGDQLSTEEDSEGASGGVPGGNARPRAVLRRRGILQLLQLRPLQADQPAEGGRH